MQAQVPSTRTVTSGGGSFGKALGGAALALVVAAGIATWQGTRQSSTPPPPALSQAATMPPTDQPAVHSMGDQFRVILVRSAEQAAMLETAGAAHAYANGDPGPLNGHVLVAGSAEEEARPLAHSGGGPVFVRR